MNQRLEKLSEQASDWVFENHRRALDDTDLYYELKQEKLAELIVQECASICYNSGFADPDAHAQNLLFHFNVDDCRNDK